MFPTFIQAGQLLLDAEELNPGGWVSHSRFVAQAARAVAEHHPDLDPVRAYVLGLLHDIGRPSIFNTVAPTKTATFWTGTIICSRSASPMLPASP